MISYLQNIKLYIIDIMTHFKTTTQNNLVIK